MKALSWMVTFVVCAVLALGLTAIVIGQVLAVHVLLKGGLR